MLRSIRTLSRIILCENFHQNAFQKLLFASAQNSSYISVQLLRRRWEFCSNRGLQTIYQQSNNINVLMAGLNQNLKNHTKISVNDIEWILRQISNQGTFVSDYGALLLQCCADLIVDQPSSIRIELIWKAWHAIKKKCSVSLELYHTLLASLIKIKAPIDATAMIENIKKDDLEPSEKTYGLILRCSCECGKVDDAVKVVSLMKERGMPVMDTVFDSLTYGFAKVGDTNSAINVLETMKSAKYIPSVKTYVALLRGLAESSNEELFNVYLSRYWSKFGNLFTDRDRLEIIESLIKGKMYQTIPKILGNENDWESVLPPLINFCVKLLYDEEFEPVSIISKSLENLLSIKHRNNTYGQYLIHEMIKSEMPIESVLHLIADIKETNPELLSTAAYATLANKQHDNSLTILYTMHREAIPLRPHYYWPIILSKYELRGEVGIYRTLAKMVNMDVIPDYDTYMDYVFPKVSLKDAHLVVRKLQDLNLNIVSFFTPLICTLINRGQLANAVELCKTYRCKVDFKYIERALAHEYARSGDVNSTIFLISNLGDCNAPSRFLKYFVIQCNKKKSTTHLKALLEGYRDAEFCVNHTAVDELKSLLRALGLDQQQDEWLQYLNDVDYSNEPFIIHPRDMKLEDLEDHLVQLKAKGMNTRGALRRLFIMHCGLVNVERAMQIVNDLEEEGHATSPGMKASLMLLRAKTGSLEEALDLLDDLHKEHPEFIIDDFKLVDFATELVKNNNLESAVNVISKDEIRATRKKSTVSRNIVELLDVIIAQYGIAEARYVLDLLVENNFCQYTNALLSVIISGHLKRNDVKSAVDEFLSAFQNYNLTPSKFELLVKLVESGFGDDKVESDEYSKIVEQILEACYAANGTDSTNVLFVMALGEAKLPQRIISFLRKPNTRINEVILQKELKRLSDQGKIDNLLVLIEAFRQIGSINMDSIYFEILKIYKRYDDYQSANKLVNAIVEEDGIISEAISQEVSEFLQHRKD